MLRSIYASPSYPTIHLPIIHPSTYPLSTYPTPPPYTHIQLPTHQSIYSSYHPSTHTHLPSPIHPSIRLPVHWSAFPYLPLPILCLIIYPPIHLSHHTTIVPSVQLLSLPALRTMWPNRGYRSCQSWCLEVTEEFLICPGHTRPRVILQLAFTHRKLRPAALRGGSRKIEIIGSFRASGRPIPKSGAHSQQLSLAG